MISHWKVIRNVATRFGSREELFENSASKLSMAKGGEIPLISLEDNMDRVRLRLARVDQPMPQALERLVGLANFQDKFVLDKLSKMAQSVCRLTRRGTPIGTGFLVAKNILLTNHHVIENPEDAASMLAEFDYELDQDLIPKSSACFRLNPAKFFLTSSLELNRSIPNSGLDFTLIGLEEVGTKEEQLTDYQPVYLDGNIGKIIKGEGCVIIQHPNGLPKKVVLKDIAFFSETGTRLVYESDTLPGSSGSMVIGLGTCEIIALHHSGLPRTDSQNRPLTKSGALATADSTDAEIDWLANEGIKISWIVKAITEAELPPQMEAGREALLKKTNAVSRKIEAEIKDGPTDIPSPSAIAANLPDKKVSQVTKQPFKAQPMATSSNQTDRNAGEYLITAINKPEVIGRIEKALSLRYQSDIKLSLGMPASANPGEVELFSFKAAITGDLNEEAQRIATIPEVLNAEADTPLMLNTGTRLKSRKLQFFGTESTKTAGTPDQEFEERVEKDFIKQYAQRNQSIYVHNKPPEFFRKWNWAATGFDKAIAADNVHLPREKGIRMVQFDTGYTNHSKVAGGFDLNLDFDFLDPFPEDGALDELTRGLGKNPGHGTRTGSLLIGKEITNIPNDGNVGLLARSDFKLVPYRIAETVIIINRQQQLAAALDKAIYQGFDVITMSMGLPPTISTAQMAKKAYDKGIIWCCAAGNVVQAVVAPAVFPGTIAVAASNPLDQDWSGSSRGDMVDITAPGQDVYVPVWKNKQGTFTGEAFAYGNGTSYATPHIAAAAAYWLATYFDTLTSPDYAGWKRVEAFRQALRSSARKGKDLPTEGFGAGILDMEKLLKTPPKPADKLKYAYNGWNEHAFFASLQGHGEILKTYWNRIHGWVFGAAWGGQESLNQEQLVLSSYSREVEQVLFASPASALESVEALNQKQLLLRFQSIQKLVENAAK